MSDEAKLGVVNVKKSISLVCALANLGDDVGRDTSAGRWSKLLALVADFNAFATIDLKAVMPEIKDLDDTEKQELLAELRTDLKLGDAQLEAGIEEGLTIIADLESVIARSVALVAKLKA